MSATKHTPGPWGVEQTKETNWVGPMRADGKKISAVVCGTDREGLKPEVRKRNDANARLIASAPELRRLVQRAMLNVHNDAIIRSRLQGFQTNEKETQWWKDAEAILAKTPESA